MALMEAVDESHHTAHPSTRDRNLAQSPEKHAYVDAQLLHVCTLKELEHSKRSNNLYGSFRLIQKRKSFLRLETPLQAMSFQVTQARFRLVTSEVCNQVYNGLAAYSSDRLTRVAGIICKLRDEARKPLQAING